MTTHPMTAAVDVDAFEGALSHAPYPQSVIDRFTDWVRMLPVPYWLTYLVLFMLQSGLGLVLSWIDGWLPAFTFSPLVMILPLWLWGPLAIVTYLDTVSLEALDDFRPLLDVPDDDAATPL